MFTPGNVDDRKPVPNLPPFIRQTHW
jgi:hypothetical protein